MKVNTKKTGLRCRKGVTIVEVVIALAIIAIVSAAAVRMVLLSVGVETKFMTTKYTENNVQSVLDCFQFTENADDFYTALQKLDDFQRVEEDTYVFTGKYLKVTLVAKFAPEKTLEYTAEGAGDEPVYTFRFPYEGGGAE